MSQNIERSIRDLREMDTLASGDSPLHKVSAGVKLLVTVVYILVVVSFDKFNMSGLMFMLLYPALLFAVSGIPVSTCFYKLDYGDDLHDHAANERHFLPYGFFSAGGIHQD